MTDERGIATVSAASNNIRTAWLLTFIEGEFLRCASSISGVRRNGSRPANPPETGSLALVRAALGRLPSPLRLPSSPCDRALGDRSTHRGRKIRDRHGEHAPLLQLG